MTRLLKVTFLILAALLCAGLAACQSTSSARVISGLDLERTLSASLILGEEFIHFEDNAYLTVTEAELWGAVNTGWQPYKSEVGDCDDQAADVLYNLRRAFRSRGHSPAAGRVTGLVRDGPHCAIWYLSAGGKLKFLDPSALTPLHPMQIQARRAFDK